MANQGLEVNVEARGEAKPIVNEEASKSEYDVDLTLWGQIVDNYLKPGLKYAVCCWLLGVGIAVVAIRRTWASEVWLRLFICIGCAMYFPCVTLTNGLILGHLRGFRCMLVRGEDALSRVVTVSLGRVIHAMARRDWVRGGELAETLTNVRTELARNDRGMKGNWRGRWLMKMVFDAMSWAIRRRYRAILESQSNIKMGKLRDVVLSTDVVRRILGREIISAITTRVKQAIDCYLLLLVAETVLVITLPFFLLPSAKSI